MSIEKVDGLYFEDLDGVDTYNLAKHTKKEYGWKSQNINGEWENV